MSKRVPWQLLTQYQNNDKHPYVLSFLKETQSNENKKILSHQQNDELKKFQVSLLRLVIVLTIHLAISIPKRSPVIKDLYMK